MNELQFTLPLRKFHDIFICHLRYCLDRTSYIYKTAIQDCQTYWTVFDERTKGIITKDIREKVERFDRTRHHRNDNFEWEEKVNEDWRKLLAWIEEIK